MKRILLAIGLLFAAASQAIAQTPQTVRICNGTQPNCPLVGGGNPLPVSATITGFAPATTGTPISVTTGGVTGTLPAGAVVAVSNVGATNGAYCKLGASATTSDQLIPPNSWFAFTVGVATQLTCITSTSTTTVNMVGGSGIPTGSGGGGGSGGLSVTDQAAWTQAASSFTPGGGTFNDAATLSSGQQGTHRLTTKRAQIVDVDTTGNALYDAITAGWPAGTNYGGQVGLNAVATGGWTPKWFVAANSDNATNLKASAGIVHAVQVFGIGSAPAYLKFYNKASSPTCGSDTIVKQIMIPAASTAANGSGAIAVTIDTQFTTGIAYCVVTGITASDDTSPAANTFVVNIDWK